MQPHALTLPCPHRRPALKEIKRSELLNVTSIEQVSGADLSLAELSAVFCIMPKLDTGVRFGSMLSKNALPQIARCGVHFHLRPAGRHSDVRFRG